MAEAVRKVASGGTMILPAVAQRMARGVSMLPPEVDRFDRSDPLTPRETEVLRLMAGGFSNREIAGALDTGEGTVKNHVSSILSKLGVRDRTRAVLRALELEWI